MSLENMVPIASGSVGQALPRAQKQRGRLLIGVLHGSLMGGISRSKGTPLKQLIKFIDHEKEDVVRRSVAGVGSNSGKLWGKVAGALGVGSNKTVVMLYQDIAENFRPETPTREQDLIILLGFSRGGDAEIKVAKLINDVGLVIDGNDKIWGELYDFLVKGDWGEKAIRDVKAGHEWIPGVKIAELIVFDAVSTFGVPATGIGRLLKVLPGWSKNNDHMIEVPPNVLHTSAVIITHDPRAPYQHSTLCIPEGSDQVLRQKYFHGRHTDSMNIGPMAYHVQNLQRDLGLAFDQAELGAYFPGPTAKKIPDWVFSTIKPVNSMVLAILGNQPRMPRRNTRSGFVTNEEISSSLRHRGYGGTDLESPVEGFYLGTDPTTGRHTWVQKAISRSKDQDESGVILRLPEGVEGDFERQLSGLPANG